MANLKVLRIKFANGIVAEWHGSAFLSVYNTRNLSHDKVAKLIANNFPINRWERHLIASRMASGLGMHTINNHISNLRSCHAVSHYVADIYHIL